MTVSFDMGSGFTVCLRMGVLVSARTRPNTGSTELMGYSGCFHRIPSYAQGASIPGEGSSCGGANWSLAPYGHRNCPLSIY
jgi:hypothetical protein